MFNTYKLRTFFLWFLSMSLVNSALLHGQEMIKFKTSDGQIVEVERAFAEEHFRMVAGFLGLAAHIPEDINESKAEISLQNVTKQDLEDVAALIEAAEKGDAEFGDRVRGYKDEELLSLTKAAVYLDVVYGTGESIGGRAILEKKLISVLAQWYKDRPITKDMIIQAGALPYGSGLETSDHLREHFFSQKFSVIQGVYQYVFSPHDKYIGLTLVDRKEIRDLESGELVWSQRGQGSITFHLGNRFALIDTSFDYKQIVNLAEKKIWWKSRGLNIPVIDFSEDGKHVWIQTQDPTADYVTLDLEEGPDRTKRWGRSNVLFSSDGRYRSVKSSLGAVSIQDPQGREVYSKNDVSEVRFSPKGKYVLVVSGSSGGLFFSFGNEVNEAQIVALDAKIDVRLQEKDIRSIIFSPDDRYVWISFNNGNSYIKELATGKIAWPDAGSLTGHLIGFSSNGQYVAILTGGNMMRIIDLATKKEIWEQSDVAWGNFNIGEKCFLVQYHDGLNQVRDFATKQVLWEGSERTQFSPDGTYMGIQFADTSVQITEMMWLRLKLLTLPQMLLTLWLEQHKNNMQSIAKELRDPMIQNMIHDVGRRGVDLRVRYGLENLVPEAPAVVESSE